MSSSTKTKKTATKPAKKVVSRRPSRPQGPCFTPGCSPARAFALAATEPGRSPARIPGHALPSLRSPQLPLRSERRPGTWSSLLLDGDDRAGQDGPGLHPEGAEARGGSLDQELSPVAGDSGAYLHGESEVAEAGQAFQRRIACRRYSCRCQGARHQRALSGNPSLLPSIRRPLGFELGARTRSPPGCGTNGDP